MREKHFRGNHHPKLTGKKEGFGMFGRNKKRKIEEESLESILKEVDKESNVRVLKGFKKHLMTGLLVAFALYVFWMTLLGNPPEQVRRASFLGALIFIGFLLYPMNRKDARKENVIPWYDWVLSVLGAAPFFYYVIFFEEIVGKAVNISQVEVYMAILGVLLLAELCRRVVGFPILVVAAGFILYAFSQGHSVRRIAHQLFYTTDGILGTPLGVAATFIVLFIILGSFLEKTGIGTFFVDMANSIAGGASGGPAKVAVISSALEGMYSGSSVANTVGSGSVTIPIMKNTGYKSEFAAAVEAAASTGGQIMPPIMGAAAFLMAEMTGIPYATIAVTAILPALLYFSGIFMMIHLEAKKLGLKGLPKESIPNFFKLLLKKGYLFLPIVTLVVLMGEGRTPAYSAIYAILTAIVVSMFHKDTRLTPTSFIDALAGGSRNTMGVAIACAIAGIIVGMVTLTGLGQDLLNGLLVVAGTSKFLALFLTMVSCIILGMGVPTTANYVIMATITAPIVVSMGVPVLAAHMFVFYFGIVADITPPVALAAYAGSAIAKSDPFKTGIQATRLAITAFIIPYIFVYNPQMLFIDTNALEVISITITSLLGVFGLSAAMEGFIKTDLKVWERLLMAGAGLLLIDPNLVTDTLGILVIGGILFHQVRGTGKENKVAREAV